MMKNMIVLTTLVAALAACEQFDGNRDNMDSPKIIAAEQYADENKIAPGSEVLTVDALVQEFDKLCVQEKSPAANGFDENKVTGTWYHPKYNLAVNNTRPDVCQMVFGSGQDLETVTAAFVGANIPGFVGVSPGEAAYKGAAMYLATREK